MSDSTAHDDGTGGGAPVVIYIAGSGRSGSTLVERTLGAIPGFVNLGELIELFRRTAALNERCGCGEPFGQCPFWVEVGIRAFGGWSEETLSRVAYLQSRVARQRRLPQVLLHDVARAGGFTSELAEYRSAFGAIYAAAASITGSYAVVDASKWPGQGLALSTDSDIDLRILHVVRDARGVAYSWQKSGVARPQTNGADKQVMATHSSAYTSVRWVAFQLEATVLSQAARHAATLRYEDFVTAPRDALATALQELGLPSAARNLGHLDETSVRLPASHGLSGNPSRFEVGDVTLRLDEAWRTQMKRKDKVLVSALAAVPLARFGYAPRRDSTPAAAAAAAAPMGAGETVSWPAVTVVLPTRGRPELVRRSLQAVMQQRYDGPLECIVVHDQETADMSLQDLGMDGRPVRVVTNTHKPGLAGARNTGLELTDSPILASCDDDDVWLPDKLRRQVQLLLEKPELLVVGSGIRLMMPAGRVVEWPGRAERISRDILLRNRVKELHSSTLVMRRDAFAKAGLYDEDLPFGYGEDYDWVLRVSRVGLIGVVREPLAEISKDVPSWFRERIANTASALELLLEKHPEITTSRRGHARVLGQIAFAKASLGQRTAALRLAAQALLRWPLAPHALLAIAQAGLGLDPRSVLAAARKLGRGLS